MTDMPSDANGGASAEDSSSASSSSSSINAIVAQAAREYRVCQELQAAGEQRGKQFDAARRKLARVHQELSSQMSTAKQLLNQLKTEFGSIIRLGDGLRDGPEALKELDDILDKLKVEKIDPHFHDEDDDVSQCLFDFVDIEAVDALRFQAAEEIAVLDKIREVANTHVQQMQAKFDTTEELGAQLPSSSKSDEILNRVQRNINEQQLCFRRIRALYTQLRLGSGSQATPYDAMTKSHSLDMFKLQHVQGGVRAGHDDMLSLSSQIEKCVAEHSSLYIKSVNVFTAVEQLGPQIRNRLREIKSLTTRYQQGAAVAQDRFEEVRNLTEWYKQFHIAYSALFREIPRRREQIRKQQELIDAFKAQISSMMIEESRMREQFFQSHGRYLPSSLCPCIDEPLEICRVVPETLRCDLPPISEDNQSHPSTLNVNTPPCTR